MSLSSCAQEQPQGNIKTPPPINHVLGEIPVPVAIEDSIKPKPQSNQPQIKGKVVCEPVDQIKNEPIKIGDVAPVVQGGIGYYEPEKDESSKIHQFAEKMPEFKGGINAMSIYIQNQLVYPKFEKENRIEGNVYVRFVVDKNGKLTHPEILKSVEGSKNFDKEVLRVINSMPLWTPGENNGKKVPVYMTIPFQFSLK